MKQHLPLTTHAARVCFDGTLLRLTNIYIYIYIYIHIFFLLKARIPAGGNALKVDIVGVQELILQEYRSRNKII